MAFPVWLVCLGCLVASTTVSVNIDFFSFLFVSVCLSTRCHYDNLFVVDFFPLLFAWQTREYFLHFFIFKSLFPIYMCVCRPPHKPNSQLKTRKSLPVCQTDSQTCWSDHFIFIVWSSSDSPSWSAGKMTGQRLSVQNFLQIKLQSFLDFSRPDRFLNNRATLRTTLILCLMIFVHWEWMTSPIITITMVLVQVSIYQFFILESDESTMISIK